MASCGGSHLAGSRMARHGSRSPLVVVGDEGEEVAVVVDYRQYVSLLALLSSRLGCGALPRYWRRAVEGCLSVAEQGR